MNICEEAGVSFTLGFGVTVTIYMTDQVIKCLRVIKRDFGMDMLGLDRRSKSECSQAGTRVVLCPSTNTPIMYCIAVS